MSYLSHYLDEERSGRKRSADYEKEKSSKRDVPRHSKMQAYKREKYRISF